MKKILIACLLLTSWNSMAASMIVGGLSYHIGVKEFTYKGETKGLNEVNPTIGIDYQGYSVAVMENSYEKTSFAVAKTFTQQFNDTWAVGLKVGAMTGYKDTPVDMAVTPIFQPELVYTVGKVSTVVGFMPTPFNGETGVFTLHWKVKL